MTEITEARSGTADENLQEILDAGTSAAHATLGGQQQYFLPPAYAELCNTLLPAIPGIAFDPQAGSGNLVKCGLPRYTDRYGFDIDKRFTDDGIVRVTGNCVDLWAILDEIYPDLRFQCQNANPPFGIRWKTPAGNCDSSEYTWLKIMQRASPHGYGFFVSNYKTIERLGIHKHERVYLYQRFPAGVWPGVQVEIGIVHWDAHPKRFPRAELVYQTLDLSEHAATLAKVKAYYEDNQWDNQRENETESFQIREAFNQINVIVKEERAKRPDYNIWLEKDGLLRTYLSTRFQIKRKVTREEVIRLDKINKVHPLTLTTERESRKLLAELVNAGVYTIQPEARKAMEDALAEVARMSAPVMPTTTFEAIAYLDEEDTALCISDKDGYFTKGKRYEITTNSYAFMQEFTRKKPHYDEAEERMYTVEHHCMLSGTDRYIAVISDDGRVHRFMDHPQQKGFDHDESEFWTFFDKPVVNTIAETQPEIVAKNKLTLKACEMVADFAYFPGQYDFLSRVACKDYGIIAGAVGTGKSLMAISIIQIKGPKRALIIAPQATMRSSTVEDDDEDGEAEQQASQWLSELRRFAPGMAVFQLFSMEDYYRIKNANGGELPPGVYVSYYEGFFYNGARESAPDSWNDERLQKEVGAIMGRPVTLPECSSKLTLDSARAWSATVGHEKNGIRCIIKPCMATLIGQQFDAVMLDEAHKCCNGDALVSQMLIRLQPKYRYCFTATPIPNIVSNLFNLMGWIAVPDWYKGDRRNAAWPYARNEIGRFISTFQSEERDFTQEAMNSEREKRAGNHNYRQSKCVKTSPIISAPARLLKILKPSMAYISKPMCRPEYKEAKLVDVRVPMGTQQTKLYAHFMNRANIAAKNPLVRARKQIAYLRNICADPAGFTHGGPRVHNNFNPKTIAILELVRDIVNRGDQTVIVCARKGQTNTLQMALKDAGVLTSRIDSTISAEQHSYQSNLFKRQRTQVHLMGIKCALGHSYDQCPNLIAGSLEYSYGSLEQARGRVDRVNSQKDRTIYCILNEHSIACIMYDVVAVKEDSATICLRGQRVPRDFKPVDMSEVLATALDQYSAIGTTDETECQARWTKLRATFKP